MTVTVACGMAFAENFLLKSIVILR